MNLKSRLTKFGLIGSGLLAGAIVAGTAGAQAATSPAPTPSASSSAGTSSTTAVDPHPGDNGADGVPEAQEVHGGRGGALDLTGTVTAVGSSTVTIKTSTGTAAYTVTSSSDIDKSGEVSLSALAVGDAVTFSVDSTSTTTIDKLHAGDETKNVPAAPTTAAPSSTSSSTA